jgi:AraC-like DNA-binding protein
MRFNFDFRASDSPLVEAIWHTQSDSGGGSFISVAVPNWEMVLTRQEGRVTVTVRGPETHASPAPIPQDADFVGITFKLGAFMPALPVSGLVDRAIHLPGVTGHSFWLDGSAWQFPTFDTADTFVNRLVRQGLVAYDPVVAAAVQGELKPMSVRTLQRRVRRATGLTQSAINQIQRARHAMTLLEHGLSIGDTVVQAGYADQPHLTRSLKRLIGQTPAQLIAASTSR